MSRSRFPLAFAGGVLATMLVAAIALPAWNATAAPGDDDATFAPIEPCRLVDTRPGTAVGSRTSPLGPGEIENFTVHGTNGDCTGLDTSAVGVALNATIVGPTAASFLTIYPGDSATVPVASNLNWVAGQAPTPNKVDVKLGADGSINVFNSAGSVHVILDVVGLYLPSSLTELDARLTALEEERPFVVDTAVASKTVTETRSSVATVAVDAPTSGRVMVSATGWANINHAGQDMACRVTAGPSTASNSLAGDVFWEASGATANSASGEGDGGVIAVDAVFDQAAGEVTYHLGCMTTDADGRSAVMYSVDLTAVFIPD